MSKRRVWALARIAMLAAMCWFVFGMQQRAQVEIRDIERELLQHRSARPGEA